MTKNLWISFLTIGQKKKKKVVSMSMPTSEKRNNPDCHSHRPADTIETRDFIKHYRSEKYLPYLKF